MSENSYLHLDILKKSYLQISKTNPMFSMRAYSKFLNIDSSSLTKILKGSRKFPIAHTDFVVKQLKLNEVESAEFFRSVLHFKENVTLPKNEIENDKTFEVDEGTYYKIIANWEYYAFLNLIGLDNFVSNFEHVSKRLGIEIETSKTILKALVDVNLIEITPNGRWIRTEHHLRTSNGVSSKALIESHTQELELAKKSLINDQKEVRSFYSGTVKTNRKAYDKAAKLSYEFMHKLVKILETGAQNEVYQIGIQLFPLTKVKIEKEQLNTDVQ